MDKERINKLIFYRHFVYKYVSKITGLRYLRNLFIRRKLKDYEFSVFSNNCIGGVFLHDANKRFNSPTVNLATDGESFMKYLENPRLYCDGVFEKPERKGSIHPEGILHGMYVNFVHYDTFEGGVKKWRERSKRIIWDHIYVIATGHDGMEDPLIMERFDKLPYKHKVMFTFGKWKQYNWAKQVKHIHGVVRPFTEFATITGKRYYESAFNLSKWIEKCEEEYK